LRKVRIAWSSWSLHWSVAIVEKTRISIQPLSHPLEEAATLFPIKETSHLRAYKFTPRRLLLIFLSFLFEKIFDGHLPFLGLFGESFQRSPLPQRKAPPCDTVMESSICSFKVHNSSLQDEGESEEQDAGKAFEHLPCQATSAS
jgi:hypothetical protein